MKKIITILKLVIPVFVIWYYYPYVTFKGTYERSWLGEKQYVVIDDQYTSVTTTFEYQLKPFRRMIWVDLGHETEESLFPLYLPVKLGWNKIYEWDFKSGGWNKLKKLKHGEPAAPHLR